MTVFGSPSSVLVTGANRGIGLGLVKKFLADPNVKLVIAGVRNPEKAKALLEISDPRLKMVKLDVACDKSIDAAFNEVSSIVGPAGLNLLVNNAGVLNQYWTTREINRDLINQALNVNISGTTIVSQTFLPLLRKASASAGSGMVSAAIVNISSFWASIANNEDGSGVMGSLIMRMCKTALNQLGRTMALDLKNEGIAVVQLCPGWVRTDMGTDAAEITIDESVTSFVSSIGRITAEHSGRFFDRNLEPINY